MAEFRDSDWKASRIGRSFPLGLGGVSDAGVFLRGYSGSAAAGQSTAGDRLAMATPGGVGRPFTGFNLGPLQEGTLDSPPRTTAIPRVRRRRVLPGLLSRGHRRGRGPSSIASSRGRRPCGRRRWRVVGNRAEIELEPVEGLPPQFGLPSFAWRRLVLAPPAAGRAAAEAAS